MTREIKFRAWIKPGKMQYDVVPFQWDYCINRMFYRCIKSNGEGILGSGGTEAEWEINGYAYEGEAKNSLMQYTGLKDKNGKEIYEGDIIEFDWFGSCVEYYESLNCHAEVGDYIKIKDVVVFQNHCWTTEDNQYSFEQILIPNDTQEEIELEIIGNIYEHKHLLENGKQNKA